MLANFSNSSSAAILAGTRQERIALQAHAVKLDEAEVARLRALLALADDAYTATLLEGAEAALERSQAVLAAL